MSPPTGNGDWHLVITRHTSQWGEVVPLTVIPKQSEEIAP